MERIETQTATLTNGMKVTIEVTFTEIDSGAATRQGVRGWYVVRVAGRPRAWHATEHGAISHARRLARCTNVDSKLGQWARMAR